MSRATDDLMDKLHGTVAKTLFDEIERYKKGRVLDGDGKKLPVPASLVAQAIKFLKDNKIDAPGKKGSDIDSLEGLLKEEEDYEDNVVSFPQ